MALSKKTWTGIAREATPGTAIATPTVFVPTKTTLKGGKKREYLNEERGDRNANYGVVDSIRQTALDFKGPWYNDVHTYLLIGAMGGNTSAQPSSGTDPTVWKHTMNLADAPASFTVFRSMDAVTYYVPYFVVEKFALKFATEGKLLECDVSGVGLYAQVMASPPTPNYSTLNPFAGYAPLVTLGGSSSNDVIDMDIEFDQKVTLWYPANGTQDFIAVYFGERKATVSFTARFDNTPSLGVATYNKWRNNTMDSLTLDILGPTISNTYKQELNMAFPNISYDSVEHDTGKDNVLIKAKATAIAVPGASLMTAYVQNTVTSYTL